MKEECAPWVVLASGHPLQADGDLCNVLSIEKDVPKLFASKDDAGRWIVGLERARRWGAGFLTVSGWAWWREACARLPGRIK